MASVSLICGLGARKVVRVPFLVKFVNQSHFKQGENLEGKRNQSVICISLLIARSNLFHLISLSF